MRPNWIHWSMFEWIDAKHRRHFFTFIVTINMAHTQFFNVAATHPKIVCWWVYFPGSRKLKEFEWLEKVLSGTPIVLPVMTTGGHAILNRFRLFGANPLPDIFLIYDKQGLIIQSISKTKSLVVKRFPLKKTTWTFYLLYFLRHLKVVRKTPLNMYQLQSFHMSAIGFQIIGNSAVDLTVYSNKITRNKTSKFHTNGLLWAKLTGSQGILS